MKLHLPYGLRKALLTCLAAMTVSLPATLGTASGWAAVWLTASRVAQAGETPPASEQTDEELSNDDLMLITDGAVSWTTTQSSETLTWNTESTDWDSGGTFTDGNAVSFLGAGGTVTVGAAVTAGSLTIGDAGTAGNNAVFTLTASTEQTVTVTDAVTVNSGYSLKLDNVTLKVTGLGKVTGIDRITGTGTLNVVLSAAGETMAAATTLNVNTTISKGDGVNAASLTLGSGKGITLAAGKTLTIGNGVTVVVNDANLFTLQGSGDGQAKIVLEKGAVLDVGGTLSRLKGSTWLNISGEGEVYHLSTGNIGAKNISLDTNYHVVNEGAEEQFFQGVGTINVCDFILDGKFEFDGETDVTVRGLVGTNPQDTVSAFGTWIFENNTDESKQYAGTFKSSTRKGSTGVEIIKKGTGTQEIGTLGNFVSMDVQSGTMKLNAITPDASCTPTITLASGATLDLSGATSFSVGNKLTINVTTADAATDGVFTSGKLLLNDTIFTALSEAATGGKLSLTLTGLTEEAAQGDGGWTCDLFAGSSFTTTDANALSDFLKDALALDWFDERTNVTVDTATGRVTFVQGAAEVVQFTVSGNAQNLAWKDNGQIVPGGDTFTNEESVIFTNSGSDPAVVTMEGTLITSNFTVAAGQWTFRNSGTTPPTLTIKGEVSVAADSLVLWETLDAVALFGDSIIEGTWTGKKMTVTLGDAQATAVSDITMEVGGDSDQSSMDVASIVTAGGDHAPTTHLVVTGQGHLTVTGEVNVVDVSVGNVQSEVSAAEGAAGSQLVTGNLTLSGSSAAAANPADVLRVGTDGTVTVSGTLTSTGANASITVDGGTLVVGTAPSGDPGTPELVLKMQKESGILNVTNGGHVTVNGYVASAETGERAIGTVSVSGDAEHETILDVHGDLFTGSAVVNGGELTVDGLLSLKDPNSGNMLTIEGGGIVTAGTLAQWTTKNGHAGLILVGGDTSMGTLVVGSEDALSSAAAPVDVLKARGMKVQYKGGSDEDMSAVTVYGDVNFHGTYEDSFALIVDAGSVDVKGSLHGDGSTTKCSGVKVSGGGNLTVGGAAYLNTLDVEDGTVTFSRGMTAGSATLTAGSLTLSGDVNVPTLTLDGGTATMQAVNVTENGAWTVNGGILDLTVAGALTVAEGKSLTINVTTTGDTVGGKLRLTDAVMTELLTLKTSGKLTLSLGQLASDEWEYALFDVAELEGWTVDAAKEFVQGMLELSTGTLKVSSGGLVTWNNAAEMTWKTDSNDNTWSTGTGHNNWDTGTNWSDGLNALFSDDNGETITIEGTVAPKGIAVEMGTWTFTVGGSLNATGKMTVGSADGTAAHVTFGGTGAVSANGLTLQGDGTTVTFTGNHNVDMGVITLEAGTKLILQGAQTWTGTNNWDNYAAGDGEVVFQGMGVQKVENEGKGILWAFTNNKEQEGHDLGGLRLCTWEGGGEGSEDLHTTLYILAEMGGPSYHGVANIANIWVEDGNSLVLGTAALGEPRNANHHNTLHLAGNGSWDEYTDGQTADAALMLVDEDSGSNRRTIKWNIDITADTSISVTDAAEAKPQSGQQYWTLGGKMYNNGSVVEKKGDQKLILGADFTTSANAEGGSGSGTWKVSGGTLELAYTAAGTMSEWTVELANDSTLATTEDATLKALSGTGTLNVGGGTLTLGSAEGATLTSLALTGSLTVNAGSFGISGEWTWGADSSLTLGGSLQTITLSGEGWTEYLSNALSGAGNQKLTVTLGDNFLRGARGKSFTLFTGGGVADFTQYFDVDVGALSATYQGLKFNANGTLSWEKVVGPVEPGPGEDVYWGGGENESELTWGSTEDDGEFDTEPDGSGEKQVWMPGDHVHFLGDSSHTVNLADDITTGTFGAEGSSADKHATYTFQSDKDGTPRGLIVGKDMSVTHAELTFTKDVNLTVKGSVTLTDSTVSVEGKAEFGGEVSGTGILDTGEDGRISLSRTGEGGFKGKVTGTGTLATAASGQVTLSGDVSGFGGNLEIGADGTLTLSGEAVGDEVKVKASGSGTLAVDGGEADVTFSGTVGGVTLKNAGSGELTVTSQTEGNGNGAKLDGGKGGITLGGSGNVAAWNGREVTGGDITLSNVTLAEGGLEKTASGAKVYVDTALAAEVNTVARAATSQGGIVDVKGMAADVLDGIKVNAHGQLTGVTGTYKVSADKQLTLHFTAENVGKEAAGLIDGQKDFRVEFSGKGEAAEQGLHLEFDEAAIIEALREVGEGEALYLRALENGTWDAKEKGVTIDWTKLGLMDIYVTGVEFTDVGLKIEGSTRDLYVVLDGKESDSHESTAPADLEEKLATVVTEGQTLTLNWAGDGTVRNLLGEEGTKLDIKGASGQGLTVTLDNTHYDKLSDDRYQEEDLPKPEDTTVHGQDTVFLGSINGGKGVDIVKSGLGTLTVGGDYTLADGDTRLEAGALSLSGAGNHMKSLTFAYAAAPGAGEERGLLLAADSRTELGGIAEDPKAGSSVGNEVKLTGNAELTLTGTSTLANTAITGNGQGGVLRLAEGASLSFTGDKGIGDTAVDMQNAVLDLGASKSTLTELDGSGTLESATGGEVTVGGGTFTGTLGSSAEGAGAGTLVVAGEFTLDKVASAGDAKMGVRLEGKSHLTVKVGEKQGDGTDMLNFGDIELGGGQLTVDFGGRSISGNYVTGNVTGVGEGGVLEFVSNGTVKGDTIHTGFKVAEGLQGQEELEKFVKFSGVDNLLNDHTVGVEDGEVVLTLQAVEKNRLAELIPGAQKNGLAGAEMMWGSLKGRSQGELLSEIFARPDSAYARLAFYLSQCYDGGADATGLDRTLAAAAGSAISTLGAALGQDVHRQLSSIRNRTTGMGGAAHAADERLPQWHAWIQGEGNYHKLDADGLAPGYTLNSWGGTVGVDADVTRRMTLGLAVTAMYGDLKPDSPDSATGDLDTAYLSAFARVAYGAWIHTFAVSGGFADVKLDRTVSYSGGSYRTSGSTDGYALGVLYEVGYTRLMNAAGTVALQPVFNVEWRHASIDGYTESGCDAGVNTDDITQDVVTFGAGARAQFAVGSNVFNHAAILETRALVKADVGDRSGTASNAMVGDTARAEVESAEVGAVGVELGAGLSIPIGTDTGSIFVDGSVEFRSGWTSANATVGYRMNF